MAAVVATSRAWKDGRFGDAAARAAANDRPLSESTSELLAWTVIADEQSDKAKQARDELSQRDSNIAQSWVATIEARDLVRRGQWSEAAQRARRALELSPGNEVAMFLLGETERAVGDWRAAVERWKSLQVSEPRWLTLRLDITSALLTAGQRPDLDVHAVVQVHVGEHRRSTEGLGYPADGDRGGAAHRAHSARLAGRGRWWTTANLLVARVSAT